MGAVELGAQGKAPMTQHEIREPFSRMLPGAESEAVLETVEAYGQLCAGNLLLFVGRGEAGGAALAVKLLGQAIGYVQAVVGIQTGGKRRVRVRKGLPLPGHRAQADFPQGFECLAAQGGNGREREKVFRGECDRDVAGFELRTAEFGQGLFQAGFLGRCRLLPYQAVGVECGMLLALRLAVPVDLSFPRAPVKVAAASPRKTQRGLCRASSLR